MNPIRQLGYLMIELPEHRLRQLALDCRLIEKLEEPTTVAILIRRARGTGQLHALWDGAAKFAEDDSANPFVTALSTGTTAAPGAIVKGWDLTIRVFESDDLPGTWISHLLDWDVMSQGHSPAHAIRSLGEAVEMVISDDLAEGRDPNERKPAPRECWKSEGSTAPNTRDVEPFAEWDGLATYP